MGIWLLLRGLFSVKSLTVKSIVMIFCCLSFSNAQGASVDTESSLKESEVEFTVEEMEILDLTNQVRIKRGLQPLEMNKALASVARAQSADMARHHHLSHTVKGKDLDYRIEKSGYDYRNLGENIARSKGPFPHVIHMWMKSPGHRKNILNPLFKEMGVGITKVKNGDRYFTQVFGTQK